MRGAVFLGNRKVEIRSFPDPTPGPGEVVIRMRASGMCGSDLKFYRSPPGEAQKALGLGWIPLERHMALIEAARRVLPGDSPAAFRAFHRDAILLSLNQPFFKTIIDGFVRAFGLSPRSIMKAAPAGYGYAFRGCGELKFEASPDEHQAKLFLDGFPPEYIESGTFCEGMLASLESFLVLCHAKGEATLAAVDPSRGRAELVLTWTPATSSGAAQQTGD